MIISQTPYRVSFAGGGTDLPAFYQHEPGAVLSTAIARHMYVTIHRRFEPNIRVAYSETETADDVASVRHDLVRECLRMTGTEGPLEVTTIGDVPAGTGMGSSSALTVGLLNALHAFQGRVTSSAKLAEAACRIEIDVLGRPIGRQDQYAVACGGVNYIRFNPDGSTHVEPMPCRAEVLDELERRALLLYTDVSREASGILKKQSDGTAKRLPVLRQMRDLAGAMRETMSNGADLDGLADLLHEGWRLKRSLGFGISNGKVDELYEAARRAGARGGKLLGAGGGGFLLLLAPPERHEAIREATGHPHELPFAIDRLGSRIVFISDHR